MKKLLLLLVVLIMSLPLHAQKRIQKELDSVTTIKHAKRFIASKKSKSNKIITFNEEKHKTQLTEALLKLGKGGTKIVKNDVERIHYKILEKRKIVYYRVNYIVLDGNKLSVADIDKLRNRIVTQLNNGVPFKNLARQYSMDVNRNRGGDSGWITYGDMLPEFEQQVMNDNYAIGDVYLVDVESNKWYYVVQKSYEKKNITEIKVLKVVEPKR